MACRSPACSHHRWPDGGDKDSAGIAAAQHRLIVRRRAMPTRPSGAELGRTWVFSKETWSGIINGERWAGQTVLTALGFAAAHINRRACVRSRHRESDATPNRSRPESDAAALGTGRIQGHQIGQLHPCEASSRLLFAPLSGMLARGSPSSLRRVPVVGPLRAGPRSALSPARVAGIHLVRTVD